MYSNNEERNARVSKLVSIGVWASAAGLFATFVVVLSLLSLILMYFFKALPQSVRSAYWTFAIGMMVYAICSAVKLSVRTRIIKEARDNVREDSNRSS